MVDKPLQIVWLPGCVTVGDGFTVMVNVFGGPGQVIPPPVYCGVTVIVATTGTVPILTAGKEEMGPIPLAANPMDVVLLDQV